MSHTITISKSSHSGVHSVHSCPHRHPSWPLFDQVFLPRRHPSWDRVVTGPPASAWFVPEPPHRTERGLALIPNCNAPGFDRLPPQTNTSLSSELCPHSLTSWKTSQEVTHPEIAPGQARLTLEFSRIGFRKEDASCWYR